VGIINLLLLHEEGQTIGKIIMKTKIVLVKNGQNGGVWHNMILRNCCYYPFAFLSMLSSVRMAAVMVYFLVCLTDSLMIFRGDRRCMHDFIAKTRVVKA
jgi:uncharacterized RDD family membrane protein YckC